MWIANLVMFTPSHACVFAFCLAYCQNLLKTKLEGEQDLRKHRQPKHATLAREPHILLSTSARCVKKLPLMSPCVSLCVYCENDDFPPRQAEEEPPPVVKIDVVNNLLLSRDLVR